MKEQRFWILALSKKSDADKIEVLVLSSDDVPPEGVMLQIISLSNKKSVLAAISRQRRVKENWGCRGLIDPTTGITSLGSRDKQDIIARATGNRDIQNNKKITCGKGKWSFYAPSEHGCPWLSS